MAEIRSREFWERHVAACEASGEKRAAYCRRHDLNYWTFNAWRGRLRSAASGLTSSRQALVPVVIRSSPAVSPVMLELRVGARMTLSVPTSVDAVWLGAVLREASTC
jgi:transposase-like protein